MEKNIEVVSIEGNYISDLDHQALIEKIDSFIQEGTFNFVINMSGLNFINSSGLGVLIRILTKSRTNGGETYLAEIPEKVNQLLAVTKLNNVFQSFASSEEAVNALK